MSLVSLSFVSPGHEVFIFNRLSLTGSLSFFSLSRWMRKGVWPPLVSRWLIHRINQLDDRCKICLCSLTSDRRRFLFEWMNECVKTSEEREKKNRLFYKSPWTCRPGLKNEMKLSSSRIEELCHRRSAAELFAGSACCCWATNCSSTSVSDCSREIDREFVRSNRNIYSSMEISKTTTKTTKTTTGKTRRKRTTRLTRERCHNH